MWMKVRDTALVWFATDLSHRAQTGSGAITNPHPMILKTRPIPTADSFRSGRPAMGNPPPVKHLRKERLPQIHREPI